MLAVRFRLFPFPQIPYQRMRELDVIRQLQIFNFIFNQGFTLRVTGVR